MKARSFRVFPTGISIPASGDLPGIYAGITAQQLASPASRLALSRLADTQRGRLSFASLPALIYVASLRASRFLLIRAPELELLHRMCNGIQEICWWALGLSFPFAYQSTRRLNSNSL